MRWSALALLLAVGTARAERVVVYTSVDQVFAKLETFDQELASALSEAAGAAEGLEKALRRVPGDAAQAGELFERVARPCRACHARFRD